MALPKKKYIQNCTGSHVENKRNSSENSFISRIIFFLLLIIFIGVTVYILFFSFYLKITNINITGNEELSTSDINNMIEDRLQGNLLGFMPKNNYLLVRKKSIENIISDEFRKVEEVSVSKKFPDTLDVSIKERKALLLLCNNQSCFLIDENGIAYGEADFNSPEIAQNNLIRILDRSSIEIKNGDSVMDKSYVDFALSLKDSLKSLGLEITDEYSTPSLMADELDVKMMNGEQLYFSTQFPIENSIKTLDLLLKNELAKLQDKNLDYIDLRTENKVFYKIKSSEVTSDQEAKPQE